MGISIWTKERVAAFQKHCDRKLFSYQEIADKLTAEFGILFTRNACIGRAGRMGIVSDRPSPRAKASKVRVSSALKPRLIKTGFASFAKAKLESIEWKLRAVDIVCETPFDDVTGCRYPVGEGPFLFCNGKQQHGSSYCTAHHVLCCEKPKPRHDKYLVRAAA